MSDRPRQARFCPLMLHVLPFAVPIGLKMFQFADSTRTSNVLMESIAAWCFTLSFTSAEFAFTAAAAATLTIEDERAKWLITVEQVEKQHHKL